MTSGIELLLVEDDPVIVELLETSLEEAGYSVTVVSSVPKALGALDEGSARLRAVITDVQLGPGGDGWDVGRRTRELVPDMPVIYVTGSGEDWSSKGVPKSVLIAKPFAPAQLVTAISMLLNKADPPE